MSLTYNPGVFDVMNVEQAKSIILTPEDSTTEARWQTETGYLADLVDGKFALDPGSVVLDYGCGIGRMARELIQRTGCSVIGVDISPAMRVLALQYVQSERFVACSPELFDALVWRGLRVDAALSVWVLQHCLQPMLDIERIRDALKPDGVFLLINSRSRAVPTVEDGWVDDGLDVKAMALDSFHPVDEGVLDESMTTRAIAAGCYWAALLKQAGEKAE